MSNSHKIAAKLEDYLDSGYFSGAIMDVYMLINHIHFLEQQVADLKDTIARIQSDTGVRVGEMYAKVDHLPDPYRLDVAYADGQPIGTVEKFVMDEPDPDRLGPDIRRALRDGFTAKLRESGDGDCEELEC